MEIYVTKKKNALIKKLITKESYSFNLNYHEHGYVVEKSFDCFSNIFSMLTKDI